jgi:hypothetical protein
MPPDDEELEDDFDDEDEDDDGDICGWCGADIGAGDEHEADCDADSEFIDDTSQFIDKEDDEDDEEDAPN